MSNYYYIVRFLDSIYVMNTIITLSVRYLYQFCNIVIFYNIFKPHLKRLLIEEKKNEFSDKTNQDFMNLMKNMVEKLSVGLHN